MSRMPERAGWTLIVVALLLPGCGGTLPEQVASDQVEAASAAAPTVVRDELIVMVKPGTGAAAIDTLFADAGVTAKGELGAISAHRVGFTADQRDNVRASLQASPLVEGVLGNRIIEEQVIPNDPMFSSQWHHAAIGATAAWEHTTGSEEVLVAVLDSGVDVNHADLKQNLLAGGNTIGGEGWTDTRGHGTSVTGVIAAASNNAQGVASLVWSVPVLPIRVSNDRGQTTSWALATGIALAMSEGAKVINISFAPLHDDPIVLRQACQARLHGSLVVISAGNSGTELDVDDSGLDDAALFVSAVDRSDRLASFSSFGAFVDVAAPGMSIYTTRLGGGYDAVSGTSFAAPIISGVAALIWSLNPAFRSATVESIVLGTAKDLGDRGPDRHFGAGRVDAAAALQRARETVEAHDETPPDVSIRQPLDGSTVHGYVTIEVLAGDAVGVADVTLMIDGKPVVSDPSSPYLFLVSTTDYSAGPHEVAAVARDTTGNAAVAMITLHFSGATDGERPSLWITQPAAGATVRSVVTISAKAADNRGLSKAELYIDDVLTGTVSLAGVETTLAFNWNTLTADLGSHTAIVRVFDASGNAADASLTLIVTR